MRERDSEQLKVFFSNRLEALYAHLKERLFGAGTSPFMQRLVVVYGPAMQSWLMLKMAQDPDLEMAMGVEFVHFHRAFELLLNLSSREHDHSPPLLELALVIEQELALILLGFSSLSREEQEDWAPLLRYLKIDPSKWVLSPLFHIKRNDVSQLLVSSWPGYSKTMDAMPLSWLKNGNRPPRGWQPHLWRQLLCQKRRWSYPARLLQGEARPLISSRYIFFQSAF